MTSKADKTTSSRNEVREKLIVATLNRLEETGVPGVRARDLAKEAGCAVGTIYNIFGDLDDLILIASARTLDEFKEFTIARFEKAASEGADERQLLYSLTEAYVDFAKAHKKRWQANFEISYSEDSHFYEVYTSGQHQLLSIIVSVLKNVSVERDERELFAVGRALWASVHGISMLAMSNPANVLPRDKILEQCFRIIDPLVDSLKVPPQKS